MELGMIKDKGAEAVESLADLTKKLQPTRVVWMMVPAGAITDMTIDTLLPLLGACDLHPPRVRGCQRGRIN